MFTPTILQLYLYSCNCLSSLQDDTNHFARCNVATLSYGLLCLQGHHKEYLLALPFRVAPSTLILSMPPGRQLMIGQLRTNPWREDSSDLLSMLGILLIQLMTIPQSGSTGRMLPIIQHGPAALTTLYGITTLACPREYRDKLYTKEVTLGDTSIPYQCHF